MMIIQQQMVDVHTMDADLWEFTRYILVLAILVIGYFAKDAVTTLRQISTDIVAMKQQSLHTSEAVDDIKKDVGALKKTQANHDARLSVVEKTLFK